MTRTLDLVRRARPEDVPRLCELLADLRDGPAGAVDPGLPARGLAERLHAALDVDDCRVLVADPGDGPIGVAVVCAVSLGPLSGERALQISHLVVDASARRHGVGRALMAAAVSTGQEWELETVVAGVYPALREAQRFYARLGFAPLAVRRVTPLAGLQRRLAVASRRTLVQDVTRRRTLGRRLAVRAARR